MRSVFLEPLGGLINGLLFYYGYRLNRSGLSDRVMTAVYEQRGRMPMRTIWTKPVSAIVTLMCGTPIAGAIYGVEVLTVGRIRHDFLLPA